MELNIQEPYAKIDGYDEYYVTISGKVYSYRERHVGWRGLRQLKPKGANNSDRYLQVCLTNSCGKKTYYQIHRLVARYFCSGWFDGAVVNHIDSDKHNNNANNLEWVSQKDNIHKSYSSSGLGAMRNYYTYNFISPDGDIIGTFDGVNAIAEYIDQNHIDASISSIIRYHKSRGYSVVRVSESCNDYPEGVILR